ncbi:hypothetical protein L6452_35949 [Arctium lappa]|uniref:Uncharacterized protein n=1 Tax=Arctium lappa TaxID=4217 RepID=A0ACB8Y7U4_ARCLA|nr:hypothetical protein L6452_35949 [Arctium lappa]
MRANGQSSAGKSEKGNEWVRVGRVGREGQYSRERSGVGRSENIVKAIPSTRLFQKTQGLAQIGPCIFGEAHGDSFDIRKLPINDRAHGKEGDISGSQISRGVDGLCNEEPSFIVKNKSLNDPRRNKLNEDHIKQKADGGSIQRECSIFDSAAATASGGGDEDVTGEAGGEEESAGFLLEIEFEDRSLIYEFSHRQGLRSRNLIGAVLAYYCFFPNFDLDLSRLQSKKL